MKRYFSAILAVILSVFFMSACCGMPQETLKTKSNAGFLKIIAEPDTADVYIDGTIVGKARDFNGKKQILELKAGKHKIEIKAEGYFPYSREMMVGAGAQEDFKVTLSKQ